MKKPNEKTLTDKIKIQMKKIGRPLLKKRTTQRTKTPKGTKTLRKKTLETKTVKKIRTLKRNSRKVKREKKK